MEAEQQYQQQANEDGSSRKESFFCRKSSTRWIPTTDQIRILKELYYNGGVRSPSPDHIKRICARLKQYGKVEGKNVFYWFQNHKAHQRQKERLITTKPVVPLLKPSVGNDSWKYPTSSNGVSPTTAPSTGMLVIGHMGSHSGYKVEENQQVETPELVTLPLFPMHGEDINGFYTMKCRTTSDGFDTTCYRPSEESGSRTPLELSLGSYFGRFLNEPQ